MANTISFGSNSSNISYSSGNNTSGRYVIISTSFAVETAVLYWTFVRDYVIILLLFFCYSSNNCFYFSTRSLHFTVATSVTFIFLFTIAVELPPFTVTYDVLKLLFFTEIFHFWSGINSLVRENIHFLSESERNNVSFFEKYSFFEVEELKIMFHFLFLMFHFFSQSFIFFLKRWQNV